MEKNILTIEEAVKEIDIILDRSEGQFHSENERYPSLLKERDYALLGKFLNIYSETEKLEAKNHPLGFNSLIASSDVAYRLLRRFLERQGFFSGNNQQKLFDAFIGRLYSNVPNREFDFKLNAIETLKERGIKFPKYWEGFVETLRKIGGDYPVLSGICFLKETEKNDKESYNIGWENIGTHMVNPAGYLYMRLGDVKDYDGLVKKIKMYDYSNEGSMYK